MKKVLVITYYWPPSGGSGVQRWMYFCKYLSEFGYDPIVVTVDPKKASYKLIDERFLDEVKSVEVHRTRTVELLKFYSWLTTGNSRKGIPHGDVNHDKKGVVYKLSAYIRGNYFVPDARVGWNRFALRKAQEIIEQNNVEIVITTGPPHSTHLVGLKLKKRHPIKWIADFRDPWSDLYYNKDLMRSKNTIRKDRALEEQVLTKADRVLTIGSKMKELLLKKAPIQEEKVSYVFNGYDSVKMAQIEAEPHGHFEMTFIGTLSPNQPYRSLLETVKLFVSDHPSANVQLCFVGNPHERVQKEFHEELPNFNIRFTGYLGHTESLVIMKSSQLLLNCLADMEHSEVLISGKQMEYISTGNPILCYGNTKGETAIIFSKIPNAKVFEKNEIQESYQFMKMIYDRWLSNDPFVNDTDDVRITENSRIETTRRLSELLNEL